MRNAMQAELDCRSMQARGAQKIFSGRLSKSFNLLTHALYLSHFDKYKYWLLQRWYLLASTLSLSNYWNYGAFKSVAWKQAFGTQLKGLPFITFSLPTTTTRTIACDEGKTR